MTILPMMIMVQLQRNAALYVHCHRCNDDKESVHENNIIFQNILGYAELIRKIGSNFV